MADARQVEEREHLGGGVERVDLILERHAEVELHGSIPGRAATVDAPAVDDEHREAMVREPLRAEVRAAGLHHAGVMRPAVRFEQHGQRRLGLSPTGEQERGAQLALAEREERGFGLDHGVLGHRRDEDGRLEPADDRGCRERIVERG